MKKLTKVAFLVPLLMLFNCNTTKDTPENNLITIQENIPLTGQNKVLELTDNATEFYNNIGIVIKGRDKEQYIVGDNIKGYFEGITNSYTQGGGYLMGSKTIYKNFATFSDGVFNNRNKTETNQIIFPYGTAINHNTGIKEEFVLHSKNYSLSLNISSETPMLHSIVPMIEINPEKWSITATDNELILAPLRDSDDETSHIIFTSNSPFSVNMNQPDSYEEIETLLKLKDNSFRAIFTTLEESKNFTLYIAFAKNIDEAKKKAEQLRVNDRHNLEKENIYNTLTKSSLQTNDKTFNKALTWSTYSASTMVVEEFGKGIWAGLPWFKDNWGRDTFIALPGTLLVTGRFEEAKEVIDNFASFQNIGLAEIQFNFTDMDKLGPLKRAARDLKLKVTKKNDTYIIKLDRSYIVNPKKGDDITKQLNTNAKGVNAKFVITKDSDFGRIPNRVTSLDNMIYNTTDGTPWLVRELFEFMQYTGDLEYGKELYPVVKRAIEGIIEFHLDSEGFMTHDDADTWMDARINGDQPWSARGSRAVEIQALWFTMLEDAIYLANITEDKESAKKWTEIKAKLKENFNKEFWNNDSNIIADRLRKDNTPDYKVRPNQLMIISIPTGDTLLNQEKESWIVKNSVTDLLYPYGIASLSEDDPYFHPYHENIRFHHKDAAYHNGTIWGWNAGLIVHGLTKYGYSDFSYELTKNLSDQILNMGTRGSMSENISPYKDKKGLVLSGTYSQAWSVSEFNRSAYQDYLGFKPMLLNNKLMLTPSLPDSWNRIDATLPFGNNESLIISGTKEKSSWNLELTLNSDRDIVININGEETSLKPNSTISVNWIKPEPQYSEIFKTLEFREPDPTKEFPVLSERGVLRNIILKGEFK